MQGERQEITPSLCEYSYKTMFLGNRLNMHIMTSYLPWKNLSISVYYHLDLCTIGADDVI